MIGEEMEAVERSQDSLCYFHKNPGYHGNHVSTHTKNNRLLRFTIMDLHAKFEDDRTRNAAGRALTRKSLRRRTRRDEAKTIVSSELCSGDTIKDKLEYLHLRK